MRHKRRVQLAFLSFVLVLFADVSASADPVRFTAFGNQLAGGRISVIFSDGTIILKPLVAMANQAGGAEQAGLFKFIVTGETFDADWTLTNLSATASIVGVTFDLTGSISLFDDGTNPSTPDSEDGVAGVERIDGPAETLSFERVRWPNRQNLGDMFLGERILWDPGVFGPNMTFTWHDDTDVVPEPATILLLSTGLAGVVIKTRKRRKIGG